MVCNVTVFNTISEFNESRPNIALGCVNIRSQKVCYKCIYGDFIEQLKQIQNGQGTHITLLSVAETHLFLCGKQL